MYHLSTICLGAINIKILNFSFLTAIFDKAVPDIAKD